MADQSRDESVTESRPDEDLAAEGGGAGGRGRVLLHKVNRENIPLLDMQNNSTHAQSHRVAGKEKSVRRNEEIFPETAKRAQKMCVWK